MILQLWRRVTLASLLGASLTTSAQTLSVTDGLQLWLKADAGLTTNVEGAVTQWDDQSGQGNHAAQSDPTAAPLRANAALNNLPVVRFDGANDFLDVADSASLSFTGDITSFFVVKFDDFATFRAVWAKTAGNLPAPTDVYALPNSGILRVFRGDGTTANLTVVESTRALRANLYLVLAFTVSGSTLTQFLNDQANGSGTVTTVTADADTPLKIGTRGDGVTRLKGDLAELLIYDRALADTERGDVFSYLQTKYDLLNIPPSISLAANPPGPNVNVGDVITLTATASDLDGTISQVEFFAHGATIATAVAPPFTARVRLESAGPVQFTARATDNGGGIADAAGIDLTVNAPAPSDLTVNSGLRLWLKAGAGTTQNTSDAVLRWDDQSGNANHAFQPDPSLGPLLVQNAVNGQPALRFDGVDDQLAVPDSDSLSIIGDIASFFVIRFTDFATFRGVWAKNTGNLPAPIDMYALPNNGRLRLFRGNGISSGIQSIDSSRPFVAGTFALAGFNLAGTALTHYYNGLPNGTGVFSLPAADADMPLLIGTRADQVTKLRGDLAELLIYDRALPDDERRSVERYLAEKYGFAALLTLTNTPPTVAIVAPGGAVLQAPASVEVMAEASDFDGSVTAVQFFADGVPIGTATSSPFTAQLDLTYGGPITLTARATDNLGAQMTSPAVVLCSQGVGRPSGLVGYWPLDGTGDAVVGLDGVPVNNPLAAADRNGAEGGALAFDGTLLQRVEVPGGGGLNASAQGTISLWVKWTGTQDTGFGGAAGAVLSRQQDGQFSDTIIHLSNADPDQAVVQWRQTGGPAPVVISGSAVVLNETWHHIVITFTTTESELYIDGFSEGAGTGGLLRDNSATPLAIGAWIGGGDSYATACIDDVAIWNRVLSADEILLLTAQERSPLDLLVTPDCLTIELNEDIAIIHWGSGAVLQSASDPAGPYDDIDGAASPYMVEESGSIYYRLRSP